MSTTKKIWLLPLCLILPGLLGLLLSLLGEVTDLGKYQSKPPRSWEKFDALLVTETPDFTAMKSRLDSSLTPSLTDQQKMLVIYDLVTHRFTHNDQAKYNVFSNWLLWLMGKVASPLSFIRSPDTLIKNGHSALCGAQAYVLQSLAEEYGIPTRRVGMHGHVVMEAWYDDDWHLYDPDLEVIPVTATQRILSLDELARSRELVRQYYIGRGNREYVDSIIEIVTSREDNSFELYGMVENRVAYRAERLAEITKWAIPLILLLAGLWIYIAKSRKTDDAS
ncbi:MAG: hypothetical protein KUG72_09175 [Pseudomonadales bacterium]|nr:hypothetical protein [Pseudomonadales bacterium]